MSEWLSFNGMRIIVQPDDAPEFADLVERALCGILRRYAPPVVTLIKIDNWFGSRWLGFAGKFLGIAGVGQNVNKGRERTRGIRIPPFVPERVVSQRRFVAPAFDEIEAGEPIHKPVPSRTALRRKIAVEAPGQAIIWYSGNSEANGRGALMAYIPLDDTYWLWFVDIKKADAWRITEIRGIKPDEFWDLTVMQSRTAVQDM